MQKIFLDINTINNISLESVYSYVNLKSTQNLPPYFLENAGSEHYKLLATGSDSSAQGATNSESNAPIPTTTPAQQYAPFVNPQGNREGRLS